MSHFITTLALEIYLLQLQTKNTTVIAMMYMYQHYTQWQCKASEQEMVLKTLLFYKSAVGDISYMVEVSKQHIWSRFNSALCAETT